MSTLAFARSRFGPIVRAIALPVLLIWLMVGARATAQDANPQETTVGMSGRVAEIVLPGSELEVVPLDAHSPLVLRIAATYPHGTAFRYDLVWWALEPGEYDLATLLRRKDGTSTQDLPRVPVVVKSLLPAGMITPHEPAPRSAPFIGGYTILLVLGGILWIVGLVVLLLLMRKKRRAEIQAARVRPQTLAERLRPLVERAMRGELDPRERAQLELSLVAHWRRRLRLDEERPDAALIFLRRHSEAGPLLLSLEEWLHRPDPPVDVDVGALLAPYRDMPPHELDAEPA
jgi:hypothetical protein